MQEVGMNCSSIRSKKEASLPCSAKAISGTEWCGKHKKSQQRFISKLVQQPAKVTAIQRAWRRWLARRCGPLLLFRAESTNPYDFFSSDSVEEISVGEFISFVSEGKGFIMDIKSTSSLLDHARKTGEPPLNPFNRSPLPTLFLHRYQLHIGKKLPVSWLGLQAVSESQKYELAVTDVFRSLEDLGNYTNPSWLLDLSLIGLQRLYIELADIWFHRASLSLSDRQRIVPEPHKVFRIPVSTVLIMRIKALKPLIVETCKTLITAAAAKGDRQLGGMYILGALTLVSDAAAMAFPWLLEMFQPGVTRELNGILMISHHSVLAY
jgi:hypothetical protein